MVGYDWQDDDGDAPQHSYVIVSQANVMFSGWETYIFPATPEGKVTDWGELPGSRKGYITPDDLLTILDYEVVNMMSETPPGNPTD